MDKRKYIILVILGLFTISLSILMGGSGNMVLADSMESVYPAVGGEILPQSLLHHLIPWVTMVSIIAVLYILFSDNIKFPYKL
jgi:Ni,Fe-hydrogenase I cytochrome b subunit